MTDITLKKTIDKLEDVDAAYRGLYVEKDGKFEFAVPDVSGLKTKNDELLAEAKTAKAARDEAQTALTEATGKVTSLESQLATAKTGDDGGWEKKYQEDMAAKDKTIGDLKSNVEEITAGATATALATKLAVKGSEGLLRRHVADRLTTQWDDSGRPTVKVLDKDGQVSARTVAELETEISNDAAYSPLLAGTKADGGGNKKSDDGKTPSKTMLRGDFQNMSPQERVDFLKEGGRPVDSEEAA